MQSTTQNGLPNTIAAGLPNYSPANNGNASADLVLVGQHQRHHRDLFTGSLGLGIPDVTTHVGSVIHAFESMAQNRSSTSAVETGEKPYELFGSLTNKTFHSPNINSSSQRKYIQTSSCSSSNVPKKSTENMQKIMSEKFDQQQHQQQQLHEQQQKQQHRHTISQYHLEPHQQQQHHHIHPQPSKQSHTFNIPVSENRGTLQQRQKLTTGDGYVKTGEIFYHPELENDASNFDSINTDDYRKNLFGNHPNVTNIDGRIFHSQTNGNYDIVNFIDLNRKKNQRPLSAAMDAKLRQKNSRNPEVFYGKPVVDKRPMSDFIVQSNRNNNIHDDDDDDHYNDNFNFNNDYDDDPTFLRGSTVSQSFIKNVKNPPKNNPISSTSSTSNGFKHDRMFNSSNNSNHSKINKRHKSTNELSDEWKTRYNYNENFDARNSTKRQSFKPRTIDRAVI